MEVHEAEKKINKIKSGRILVTQNPEFNWLSSKKENCDANKADS